MELNMKYKVVLIIWTLFIACNNSEPQIQPLELVQVYPVAGVPWIETSGLCMVNDSLFTIGDNIDHTIYHIKLEDSIATLFPSRTFPQIAEKEHWKLDFEGITSDSDGNFYLISETFLKILKVPPDPAKAKWITTSLDSLGKQAGLFQKPNALIEGITLIPPKTFILCAEREPRGLLRIDLSVSPAPMLAMQAQYSHIPKKAGRNLDFSGLWHDGQRLFILERFGSAVCEFEYDSGIFIEKMIWSFAHVEDHPDYQYTDSRYGHAEGLCMNSEHIYVIVDNNRDARRINPEDTRPLLFVFKNPY
jgi:hypothetical protein